MVEETVWVEKKYVRPRLSPDELLLIHRLIDNQYWLLRKHPNPLWSLEKISKLLCFRLFIDFNVVCHFLGNSIKFPKQSQAIA